MADDVMARMARRVREASEKGEGVVLDRYEVLAFVLLLGILVEKAND